MSSIEKKIAVNAYIIKNSKGEGEKCTDTEKDRQRERDRDRDRNRDRERVRLKYLRTLVRSPSKLTKGKSSRPSSLINTINAPSSLPRPPLSVTVRCLLSLGGHNH